MKENTSSFYVDRTNSYETVIDYINNITDNDGAIFAHLNKTVYFCDGFGCEYDVNNLTIHITEIDNFISRKDGVLNYDKTDDLTDDDKLFVGFVNTVRGFSYNAYKKALVEVLEKAVIKFDVNLIKSTGRFPYYKNVVVIEDVIFDKEVAEKVIEKATKGRGN